MDFLFVFWFKGNTYLHLAAKTGQLEVFETILSDETREKSPKNQNDSTPLHLACEYGHFDTVKVFLKYSKQTFIGSVFRSCFQFWSQKLDGQLFLHFITSVHK